MRTLISLTVLLILIQMKFVCAEDAYSMKRQEMISAIEDTVRMTREYTGKPSLDARVMAAMAAVPRHEFIADETMHRFAYENRPLPIGNGQTISQPYIVALMTDLAGIDENSVVLEVGTGSGYQAAILAELARHVYTIEIVEPLGKQAAATLQQLGYDNVTVKIGDGYNGWPEHAPFDAILVTAAPEEIPEPLVDQLSPGGRMVIPVGAQYEVQSLQLIEKDQSGRILKRDILPVGFVPLTRED
jgi:protein-L-isoaspartate(D-aspartate) O-methyltransferase